MSTSIRTTEPDNHRSARRRRRLLIALVASIATVAGPLVVAGVPAEAGPIDIGWEAAGPGTVSLISGGDTAAAAFTYDLPGAGFGANTWDFTTEAQQAATPDDPIRVPWSWKGLHAWFGVDAKLQPIINDQPVDLSGGQTVNTFLLNPARQNCCTSPSNGFSYGGVAVFDDLDPEDVYGFRLTGRNGDSNNFLRGTFTLSTRPYIDTEIGLDNNRQWNGAATLEPLSADNTGAILEAGEARWFRFRVFPGQKVTVRMPDPPRDYDLALYSDIADAFDRIEKGASLAELAAAASGAPPANTQAPDYANVASVPTDADDVDTRQFAPRVYAPRVYAPRVYAPRVYAPRVYAPRVYAPRVYAPNSYAPDLTANQAFREAFTAAQNLALVTVSVNEENASEVVAATTGNAGEYYYVRVQGHDDKVFAPNEPFHLTLEIEGDPDCAAMDIPDLPMFSPPADSPSTVIVTDTAAIFRDRPEVTDEQRAAYRTSLSSLAEHTTGVVVDVDLSDQVKALKTLVQENPECPYAVNLLAGEIKEMIDSYRGEDGNLEYVVLAGGDDVIPFFRYLDTSGIGQESQFKTTMKSDTPAGEALSQDRFLSQDAYGSDRDVAVGGTIVPLSDLAVGRLVKTPEEIESTISHFVALKESPADGTLPIDGNGTSLVTGYDFLTDAATRVGQQFAQALPGGTHDELIDRKDDEIPPWNNVQMEQALLGSHHNLVYLAGHFSANDAEAADFTTALDSEVLELPAYEGKLTDTLVLSAGCHSAYNIVDNDASALTHPEDWTQQMARQHALLIGGTGYQYGDSDFLEYSERLYLGIARRLREGTGPADPAVAIGHALAMAKQDYLASLTTLQGIDQKAVLQATLYGLPMTGFDAPGRAPINPGGSQVVPTEVQDGGVGDELGLRTGDLNVETPLDEDNLDENDIPRRHTKPSPEAAALGLGDELTWHTGTDGVSVQPGMPALPKQVVDVTAAGLVLRGVGFRSGTYTETSPLLPLTGAPAVEGSTPNSTFDSPAFFPQRLATPNYFGTLGASGRTSLILTPAQYRSYQYVGVGLNRFPNNTERAYERLGFRLFYSGTQSQEFNQNQPSYAAAPAITDVQGIVQADGSVMFRVRATGDPSAGVQQVWVTWTGGPGTNGVGNWQSLDLVQDPVDSLVWTKTLAADQLPDDLDAFRFLVQAANGVGAVGLDTFEGDGYGVQDDLNTVKVGLTAGDPAPGSPLGVTARVTDTALGGAGVGGRRVVFSVVQGEQSLFDYEGVTDGTGRITLQLPDGEPLPVGAFTVFAYIFDDQNFVADSASLRVDTASIGVQTGVEGAPLGVVATVTDITGEPWANREVTWTVKRNGAILYSGDGLTGLDGTIAVQGDDGRIPGGPLTVEVSLVGLSGDPIATRTVPIFVDALEIRPDTTFLTALPGTTFGAGIKVTVIDDFGAVKLSGLQVTYTIPAAAGKFGNSQTSVRPTDANGSATSATPTAGSAIGVFEVSVTTPGAATLKVPVAVKYGFGAFGSPVNTKANAINGGSGSLPLKWTLLGANNKAIPDAEALALISAADPRIQLRWRLRSTMDWSARTDLVIYDPSKDTFTIDLKTTDLGMIKPNVYEVEVRVLPKVTDPKPVNYVSDDSEFDVGRSIRLLVKAEK